MDLRYIIFFYCLVAGGALAKKPDLRPAQESVEKFQNDSYVVLCKTDTNEQVMWQGPGGRSLPATTGRVHVEPKTGGQALFLDHIVPEDRGQYTCTSTSKEKTAFVLSVVRPTSFKNTPSVHRVNEFQNTVIRCEVDGEPKPLVTWQRNNQTIADLKKYVPEANGLKVINASKGDSGVFTCQAYQVGKDDSFIKSFDITLKVQYKPEWKDPATGTVEVYGYLGGETNISCEAMSQPEAAYTWLRNNRDVKSLKMNTTEILEPGRSVLKLHVYNESVYGQYQCQAKNSLGSISRMFDLQRGEKPSPPTAIRVPEVTVHTATLEIVGGSGGAGGDDNGLVGYRVQFTISRPGQEINWTQPHFQDLTKNENGKYVLRDLLEDTPYTVRAAARGPAGLSDYSNVTESLRTLKTGVVRSSALRSTAPFCFLVSVVATFCATH